MINIKRNVTTKETDWLQKLFDEKENIKEILLLKSALLIDQISDNKL